MRCQARPTARAISVVNVPHVPGGRRVGARAPCHLPRVRERRRSDAHALVAAACDAFTHRERLTVTVGYPNRFAFSESLRLTFGTSVRFAGAIIFGLTWSVGVARRVVQPDSVAFADAVGIRHAFAGGARGCASP
jgi:hypothetical protein